MSGGDHSDRMRHILEGLAHIAQGVTIFDQDLRLVAWNSTFLEIYGYPESMAFPGAEFSSFIAFNATKGDYGPGDPARQTIERVAIARQFRRHRLQRRRADGSSIEIEGHPLPSGGFVTTYTDITDVVRQREILSEAVARKTSQLQLSERRLSLIADEVPAGIAHIDKDMNILYANKRFARAYGRDAAQIIGLNTSDVLHPRTLSESRKFFEQARRGALVDFEMRIELPGERFKDIRTLLRPEQARRGEVASFYLLSIDITRRKATSSALMRSQKMDALGRLASGISHDFNNLLTVILGNLVPLSEQLTDEELISEFLTPAISAARRGSSLTKRLLTLARREQFNPEPTAIGEAIEDIVKLLSSSLPGSLRLEQSNAADLPDAMVDRAQFEMALLNLAMNARDATEGRGTIRIETALQALQPDEAGFHHMRAGDYIRISFSDDGCGMSPELAETIFEPFVTSKAAGQGSGLGLSMVYQFVRQSNGTIWVESQPGEGTRFIILLPINDAAPVETRPQNEPVAAPPTGEPPCLILLVEDDPDIRRTIRRKIGRLGHHLIEAGNASEAIGLIEQVRDLNIVLSDIDMPGDLDGCGLARHLSGQYPDLPVILMSGKSAPDLSDNRLANIPFLAKPFSEEELHRALKQAVAQWQWEADLDEATGLSGRG